MCGHPQLVPVRFVDDRARAPASASVLSVAIVYPDLDDVDLRAASSCTALRASASVATQMHRRPTGLGLAMPRPAVRRSGAPAIGACRT
jgi:hypothetical protein